ncbi:zinc protease [Parabacteroides sp. PF5-5]|uniref:M16 family metallopeptidase n=1 Tax=unclassified Parabacteroides TaxID=2649774 RepID=UPI002472ED26|nr:MULTISPECIES: pitrilysin family protein [unclassified Parabacteroides]MDH6304826.1 zinc protease [Parabacteroides sp. PH5-39]MDH6315560.1 zinc protease [Parabacteroides sp. PF5-13]MDH6319220.1 zinc protease [Parabacteroides sp. PH5-13]MDH6322951.1 zinc protease [Parabacteroides sp. PH5-8]MDH6326753.1 zinc protease [Parabacteroides sp. PH5-41]
MKHFLSLSMFCALFLLTACQAGEKQKGFSLPYEKYVLNNGLEVVLHEDASDPIVAVAIQYHVGSNREKPGKTGFAHFFEHMLFQRSENLKRNEYITKINDLGGSFNGGTWKDGTIYYEVVPNDALEKVLWMESDRMGFFINTVSQQGLEREIDVVINEKRQMVDNRPYGFTDDVIHKTLYPKGHPYSWTVIGEIADLQSSTVDDVKEFYHHYYAPNNATLVIAGNFNREEAKQWVEKYFGEIQSRNEIEKMDVQVAHLDKEIRLFHEDKFANMPELTLTYPSPEMYSKDAYALDILVNLLSEGKKAPIYKEVVDKQGLAPSIRMYNNPMELAGEISLSVRAFPGKSLNDVYAAIHTGMENFEQAGVNPEDLQRIKNMSETSFYQGISSVMSKAFQIANANVFGGTPDKMKYEVEMMNAVTADDVMRVFRTYIKDKPAVVTSFVPMGQTNLALAESAVATVTEEKLDSQSLKSEAGAIQDDDYERSPSSFDRTLEPALGTLSELNLPTIWNAAFANGMKVSGIEQNELPLVYFNIVIPAGSVSDTEGKAGLANLTAQLLREGTKNKTPEELEDAVKNLGASLHVYAGQTTATIAGNCLAKNVPALAGLIREMLMEPRWDEKEFERLKQQSLARLEENKVQPNSIVRNVFNRLLLGDNAFAISTMGKTETVNNITLEDVKAFYADYYVPAKSNLLITGNYSKADTEKAFAVLSDSWKDIEGKPVVIPTLAEPAKGGSLYFVDYPDSKQSVIMIGKRAMNRLSPDYYPAVIANYKLGDGSGSDLFRVLRLERGYTYGAYSFFNGAKDYGIFTASSSVQTSVTKNAIEVFKEMISGYGASFTEENLATTRNAMLRKRSGEYETIWSLLGILNDIVITGLPADYLKQEESTLKNITLEQLKAIITKEMNFNDMIVVVVGDAKTQLPTLQNTGLGKPILLEQ